MTRLTREQNPVYKWKREQHIRHVKRRIEQRFDLKLESEDIVQIGEMIRAGNTVYLGAESNNRTHHYVEYKGKEIVVVYDKIHKVPVTVLDAGMTRHELKKSHKRSKQDSRSREIGTCS